MISLVNSSCTNSHVPKYTIDYMYGFNTRAPLSLLG